VAGLLVPASLLLGSLFASHTLVTYPAIRRLGLSRNTAVSTTVAATVLTDVLALLVLAVVSGSESGEAGGAELALGLVVGFAVLLAFSFGVLPRLVKRMFKRLARERTARFMVSLAALLAAGAMAEVFGVEAIVGAFFAGLALNRLVPNSGVLMERLEFVGSALLIPTFLVSVGLLINPAVLAEPQTLLLAAVFTAACLGGKALAAVVSIPILKMSRDEAGVVFALSSPQAAATLAAAFVGFEIGLFGERVVNAVLVLVMASLVVAPLAASTFGPRVSATDDDERPLGRAVLIPLPSLDRLRGLAWLAGRIAHADSGVVIPLVVADPSERGSRETTEMVERADGIMAEVGLDSEARVRVDHDPVAGIGLAVASESASLVVADWDPNDAERYRPVVEGSLAEAAPLLLVRLAEQPVERVVVWVSRRDHANRRPEGPDVDGDRGRPQERPAHPVRGAHHQDRRATGRRGRGLDLRGGRRHRRLHRYRMQARRPGGDEPAVPLGAHAARRPQGGAGTRRVTGADRDPGRCRRSGGPGSTGSFGGVTPARHGVRSTRRASASRG
jgi:Kef-type K+ transport system membrane component KefB